MGVVQRERIAPIIVLTTAFVGWFVNKEQAMSNKTAVPEMQYKVAIDLARVSVAAHPIERVGADGRADAGGAASGGVGCGTGVGGFG